MVGYRHYDTNGVEPRFPFGHGLSYTSFHYGSLEVEVGESVVVTVDVTNQGARPGREVVQLYVRDLESSLVRPDKELRAFRKIDLPPGDSTTVRFCLNREAFENWDPDRVGWVADPGDYELLVGSSSRAIRLRASLRLERTWTDARPAIT